MKICFLVGTLARGGAEKQLVFMLRALRETAVETKVLCLTRGEFYEHEIKNLGIEVEFVGAAGNQLRRLGTIIKVLRRARADIVQSAHFYTNLYAAIAGKILRIKSIGAVRSDLNYEIESHKLTGKWQINLPDLLIVNSQIGGERLRERGIAPAKIAFVRNVVETAADAKAPNSLINILFAGRLDANKRPAMFLRLAARLAKELPDARLRFAIAGDGVLRESLEKTAAELKLAPGRLKFLGACEAMGEIYNSADILVATSRREGTPNVVLEALANGLAVAATDAGGTREILDENCGILVGTDDEENLFKAVRRLIENQALRQSFGANGRRYVIENHSLERLRNHLEKNYARLLGSATGVLTDGRIRRAKIV